jgi:hypothetical protein
VLYELQDKDGQRLLAPNQSQSFLESQKQIFVERGEFAADDLQIVESQVVEPEPLLCLVCGSELEWAGPPVDDDPEVSRVETPPQGTTFTSRGNYGSTVWDEPFSSNAFLKVAVCDDCLVAHKERVLEIRYKHQRPELDYGRDWEGPGDVWHAQRAERAQRRRG